MHSPNSRHTAAEGPWVPDAYVPPKTPPPIQTPKPYVLVMLKGFCTEFFDTADQMADFAAVCLHKNRPFECYQYWSAQGYYMRIGLVSSPLPEAHQQSRSAQG